MGVATTIAGCLAYPHDGHLDRVLGGVADLQPGTVRSELSRFAAAIRHLSLGEWEELHTRTLDLSPLFVPYVGHVVWGESYKRGAFMAELNREMAAQSVDLGGELPDHLAPILRLLDAGVPPPGELVEVLPGAVARMRRELEKSDAANPYRHVLAAAQSQVAIETRVEIGRRHAVQ